jgi:hypothetical protein
MTRLLATSACCVLRTAHYLLLDTPSPAPTPTPTQAAMTDMFKGTAIQMRTLDLIATTYGTGDPDPREPGKLYLLWFYLQRLHSLWLHVPLA